MWSLELVTGPTRLPVSLNEFKAQARVDDDHTGEDALIAAYLRAATGKVEALTHRKLLTQTWDVRHDTFPASDALTIPLSPVQSVTSVTYVDTSGVSQTWDAYQADLKTLRPRLLPAYGETWPDTRSGDLAAVTVRVVAGYGGNPSDVPEELRVAILMLAAHLYDTRTPVNIGNIVTAIPFTVDALVEPYRVWSV